MFLNTSKLLLNKMKIKIITLSIGYAFMVVGCFAMEQHPKANILPSPEKLDLSITIGKKIFSKNERILVHVHLKNSSSVNVFIEPLSLGGNLWPYLTTKGEHSPQLLREKGLSEYEGTGRRDEILFLKPNESLEKDIPIDFKYYKFKQTPGRYNLLFEYDHFLRSFEDVPSWIGKVESNVLDIELQGGE